VTAIYLLPITRRRIARECNWIENGGSSDRKFQFILVIEDRRFSEYALEALGEFEHANL
jgi:hypothetical protein